VVLLELVRSERNSDGDAYADESEPPGLTERTVRHHAPHPAVPTRTLLRDGGFHVQVDEPTRDGS